jgi:tetratricopeptide (TPR) repeat protein
MAVAHGLLDAAAPPSLADRAGVLLIRAQERSVPRSVLAVAAFVAALTNQPADQAAELALRALDASPPLPEPGEPPWFHNAVTALHCAERYHEAQARLDEAVTEAQNAANGMILPAVLAQRARLAFRRSDLTAAEADARAVLDAPGRSAPALLRNLAASVLVDMLIERGDLHRAEEALEAVAADLSGTSLMAPILRHGRGRLRFAQRRFGEAFGDFRAAGEIATRTGTISPCYLPWRSDAALAVLALGDPGHGPKPE